MFNWLKGKEKGPVDVHQDVRDRLLRRDYEGASRAVARFESTQPGSRGMGMDWKNHDPRPDVFILSVIFGEVPEIVASVQPALLNQLQMAAAQMHLWGTNKATSYLPGGFSTGIALDADTAARMFIFRAQHRQKIEEYKGMDVRKVRILGAGNSRIPACPACQALNGKTYSLGKAPALPFKNCTCSVGCRCIAQPVIE